MVRAWQLGVSLGATLFMLYAIKSGEPWIIAVPKSLLIMSILAADA